MIVLIVVADSVDVVAGDAADDVEATHSFSVFIVLYLLLFAKESTLFFFCF